MPDQNSAASEHAIMQEITQPLAELPHHVLDLLLGDEDAVDVVLVLRHVADKCRDGAGIVRLSEHVVARSIQEGLLQPLLQDAQDPEIYPLYALMPPGRHQAPKVRVFIDFLIERLGSAPWRTGSGANQSRKLRR